MNGRTVKLGSSKKLRINQEWMLKGEDYLGLYILKIGINFLNGQLKYLDMRNSRF